MTIIDLLRLVRKHLVLLMLIPLLLAGLVVYFTRNQSLSYYSETTLYTGIASGSSIEMDKSFSFFANNTAFDNLINIINSRETQQEVAIRLLAQHLMLPKADPRYLSKESYEYVKRITPSYVYDLVAKSAAQSKNDTTFSASQQDSNSTFSFSKLYAASKNNLVPYLLF